MVKAKTTVAPKTEDKTEPKPATVTKIKVLKRDAKFRGARDAWYKVLLAHDGKTLKEFTDHVTSNHPSEPKKGVLAGKLEPPSGWVSYFKRTGIISLPEEAVKS